MAKLTKKKIKSITTQLFYKHCSCVQFDIMDLGKVTQGAEEILANGGTEEEAIASIEKMREELRKN